jgi:6-phosphogluconolactonase (cycloisomerase 2 family)
MTLRSMFVGAAATFALAGTALADHVVYTNDSQFINTVTAFSVSANGNLTNLGQFPTGGNGCTGFYASRRARISKNGDYLLVTNDCSSNVTVFSGASTGNLVFVTLIPFPASIPGASIASDGKCLVFGSGTNVSSYRFPELTPVNTVTVADFVDDMKIGKPGPNRYVAAALPNINEIAVIPLSPSTCALGTVTTIATSGAGEPTGVDFSPKNDILYVGDANFGSTIVEAFTFPAGTPLAGSPYTYSSGSNSNTVLVSKDGNCLFVANQFSSSVSAIPLSKAGVPGATATAFPAGSGGLPAGMVNDVTGKIFYVASGGDNTVTTEIIGSGCALTESPGGPVGTGVGGFLVSLTAFP